MNTWQKRPRLLIVGCGDVGLRLLAHKRQLTQAGKLKIYALSSSPERLPLLRQYGATPIQGDLDHAPSLRRLTGLAQRLLMLAPPASKHQPLPAALRCHLSASASLHDGRSQALSLALRRSLQPPRQLVYGSTSGVYGDCQGRLISESQPLRPSSARAQRRAGAELIWRTSGLACSILRIPGIYALNRAGGTPQGRLEAGHPLPQPADDVYTCHIHADDLARAAWLALWRGRPQRCYHASDDSQLRMGDYFDLAADLLQLPRLPRLPHSELAQHLSPMQMSFLRESRRLNNQRLKTELRLRLRYPHPSQGLCASV